MRVVMPVLEFFHLASGGATAGEVLRVVEQRPAAASAKVVHRIFAARGLPSDFPRCLTRAEQCQFQSIKLRISFVD